MICSECPGWVCYLEKVVDESIIPHASKVKPPQLLAGQIFKNFCQKLGLEIDEVLITQIQPCFDKKLETFRPESLSKKNI